ncbi:hypothetical protein HDU99_009089 [Rhizoclosmatium hyalinum]|nr:hypothetical protein HDU99_009089 [Rhizoclosmatium hyalinum]
MSLFTKLFGGPSLPNGGVVMAEAAAAATATAAATSGHRVPAIRFVGRRTAEVWREAAHHAPPPHFAQSAATAHVPKSDNFFNAPPFPPRAQPAQPTQPSSPSSSYSPAAPQTVAPPTRPIPHVAPTVLPITATGPAAPSTVLLYPSVDNIPRSFRAKGLSQREIDMIDLGGIFDVPKPVKKDAPKKK